MFLGDLDQPARHINSIARGRNVLMSGGSEARKDNLSEMRPEARSETVTCDGW